MLHVIPVLICLLTAVEPATAQAPATPVAAATPPVAAAPAAPAAPAKPDAKPEPTTIESETGEYDQKKHTALLNGNVHVIHQGMEMWADRVDVIFDKTDQLQSLVATGNVVIKRVEGTATCGRAEYTAATTALILTEKPVVRQGNGSIMEAPIITYNQGASSFSWQGGGRVHYLPAGEEDPATKALRKRLQNVTPTAEPKK